MPIFKYTVKNEHGDTVRGTVEAQSRSQAATILRNRSLLVITLQLINESAFSSLAPIFFGVKQDEIVTFTRQLSTMITAGLNLTDALDVLRQQNSPGMIKILDDLIQELESGGSFAKALEKQGHIFSPVYCQLVRAGETAGALDQILARLADTLEKEKEFRAKTQGALIYPVIVILVMIAVGFVMLIFVVPKLTAMYSDLGTQLPFSTQLLIDVSGFMAQWWIVVLAAIGAAFFWFQAWYRTAKGRLTYDTLMLKVPILGPLRTKVLLTEFCRTLGLLLSAGISLLQALEIVEKATDNMRYRIALQEAEKQVEKGVPLSRTIARYPIFPPILGQMMTVGEETGKLYEVLLKLALYFETESDHAVKNLTTAFEPLIMIVLGIGVGALVLTIILPIYNLTSSF